MHGSASCSSCSVCKKLKMTSFHITSTQKQQIVTLLINSTYMNMRKNWKGDIQTPDYGNQDPLNFMYVLVDCLEILA